MNPTMGSCCGNGFAFILVLFILIALLGCCWCGTGNSNGCCGCGGYGF